MASHDLQEPLRSVQAFASLLTDRYGKVLDQKGADYLERISESTRRMQRLVRDLLDYSRLAFSDDGRDTLDLNEIVRDVLEDLGTLLDEGEAEIDVDELPEVVGDATQLHQLFMNLLSNAVRFRKDGRPSRVSVRSSQLRGGRDRFVSIEVEDNGIGFEQEFAERIFTPFQRLHGRDRHEGTGLGLSICRRIAERHGGTISARSRPGEGSIFEVRLKREGDDEREHEPIEHRTL